MLRTGIALAVLLGVPAVRAADVVTLTSGLVLEGKVVANEPGREILFDDGQRVIALLKSEVESIRSENGPPAETGDSGRMLIGPKRGLMPTQKGALTAAEVARVQASCRRLATEKTIDAKAVREMFGTDPARAYDVLRLCMDPARTRDAAVRRGAIRAVGALKPASAEVSQMLGASAVADPDDAVRSEATALVKDRSDEAAMRTMLSYLFASFDSRGEVRSAALMNNSVASLRALEDRRVYESLLYYVTLELRTGHSELVNMPTRSIDGFNNINGTLQPFNLPIQLPEIQITQVKTTVVVPATAASAMRALVGEDFGDNWGRYRSWINSRFR